MHKLPEKFRISTLCGNKSIAVERLTSLLLEAREQLVGAAHSLTAAWKKTKGIESHKRVETVSTIASVDVVLDGDASALATEVVGEAVGLAVGEGVGLELVRDVGAAPVPLAHPPVRRVQQVPLLKTAGSAALEH